MWRSINGLAKRGDIPTWEFFCDAANVMVEYINDKFESKGKGMDGKTRSRVFEENLPLKIRRVSKEVLQSALYKGSVRKCGRNGVKINRVDYWHPDLLEFVGRDVLVRQSLLSDAEVPVYSSRGEFICNAVGNYFLETDDLSESIRRLEAARRLGTQKAGFRLLAERGTNEVGIDSDKKTLLDVTMKTYDTNLPDIDAVFGIEADEVQTRKLAAGAEGAAKKSKYISPLSAEAKDYLPEVTHES
jgi:hypothetical protein